MEEKTIHVSTRLPRFFRRLILNAVEKGGYLNQSEFFREAIREKIIKLLYIEMELDRMEKLEE